MSTIMDHSIPFGAGVWSPDSSRSAHFPYTDEQNSSTRLKIQERLRGINYLGVSLLLAFSLLLLTAIEEGGIRYAWCQEPDDKYTL